MTLADRLFAGHIIKDFGRLHHESKGLSRSGRGALLTKQYGRLVLVFKFYKWQLILGYVRYHIVDLEGARRLKAFLEKAERVARGERAPDEGEREPQWLLGRIVRDRCLLDEQKFALWSKRQEAFLTEQAGELEIVLAQSNRSPIGGGTAYDGFDMDETPKVRACIEESLEIAARRPSSEWDGLLDVGLTALLVSLIGLAFTIGTQRPFVLVFSALWMVSGYVFLYLATQRHPKVGTLKWVYLVLAIACLAVVGVKAYSIV